MHSGSSYSASFCTYHPFVCSISHCCCHQLALGLWRDPSSKCVQVTETVHMLWSTTAINHSDFYPATPRGEGQCGQQLCRGNTRELAATSEGTDGHHTHSHLPLYCNYPEPITGRSASPASCLSATPALMLSRMRAPHPRHAYSTLVFIFGLLKAYCWTRVFCFFILSGIIICVAL